MDKTYLKRLYTSLVVEYVFSNIANSQLEEPTEFNQYSIDYTVGVDLGGLIFSVNANSDGYYSSTADDFEEGWVNYGLYWNSFDEIVNGENLWHVPTIWYQSELRPGRVGVCELNLFSSEQVAEVGYPTAYYANYFRPSLAQVMGDYVAFIVTTTAAEKEAYYAEVEASLSLEENGFFAFPPAEDYLNGSGKTKEDVLPDIKARVELCKEYFAQYGVTLADKQ